jgi:hypothetical protein
MVLAMVSATLAVVAGAALVLHASPRVVDGVRGAVVAAVAIVVFVHLLPEALSLAGPWGAAWAAAGFLAPLALHRLALPDRDHRLAFGIAYAGLVLHAVADGIGLAVFGGDDHGHDHAHDDVVFALALHRLPVAAFVAHEAAKTRGRVGGWAAALGLAVATVVGAAGTGVVDPGWISGALGPITGVTTGLLLHVLAHRPHGPDAHDHTA